MHSTILTVALTVVMVGVWVVRVGAEPEPHCHTCGHHHGAAAGLAFAGVSLLLLHNLLFSILSHIL